MGIASDGMKISEYIENGRQEYFWMHYKMVDNFSDERYREMFQNLKKEGILANNSYDDIKWVLKGSEGRKYHVSFDLVPCPTVSKTDASGQESQGTTGSGETAVRLFGSRQEVTAMETAFSWNDRLKHYALLKLAVQKADIHSTSVNVKRIKAELLETSYLDADLLPAYREQIGSCGRSRRLYLAAFGEFLSFIRGTDTEHYLETINSLPYIHTAKPRDLPCYQSILLFDSVIDDYINRTSVEEKARYYPVLIWWKISSVIPLRPGEVYRLPKDCIYEKTGRYFIHIERVKRQFQRKKYASPIVKDFEIREDIYLIIKDYVDYIDKNSGEDGTKHLFSIKILKKTAGLKSKDQDVERLTHVTMQSIYRHFQKEIIEQQYGYRVVPLGKRVEEKDIEEIRMGDVRHLAIINLMMMGYNPLYIMELAGHHKLNIQMAYYNHLDTFATAKSHVLKEIMKRAENSLNFGEYRSGDYVLQKQIMGASYYDLPLVFDGKGRCRSKNFPYDCVHTECIFCPHFIPDRNLSREYYDALKKENEKDLEALRMELKLLMQEVINDREFEKIGKEIGVTLNKKILINAYGYLREERK